MDRPLIVQPLISGELFWTTTDCVAQLKIVQPLNINEALISEVSVKLVARYPAAYVKRQFSKRLASAPFDVESEISSTCSIIDSGEFNPLGILDAVHNDTLAIPDLDHDTRINGHRHPGNNVDPAGCHTESVTDRTMRIHTDKAGNGWIDQIGGEGEDKMSNTALLFDVFCLRLWVQPSRLSSVPYLPEARSEQSKVFSVYHAIIVQIGRTTGTTGRSELACQVGKVTTVNIVVSVQITDQCG